MTDQQTLWRKREDVVSYYLILNQAILLCAAYPRRFKEISGEWESGSWWWAVIQSLQALWHWMMITKTGVKSFITIANCMPSTSHISNINSNIIGMTLEHIIHIHWSWNQPSPIEAFIEHSNRYCTLKRTQRLILLRSSNNLDKLGDSLRNNYESGSNFVESNQKLRCWWWEHDVDDGTNKSIKIVL